MRLLKLILISLLLTAAAVTAQEDLKVVGDSLVGRRIDGKNIREVIGDVVITHKGVVIDCNKAIQYLDAKEVELIGDVVMTQDTVHLYTEWAYYYSDTQVAYTDSNVTLDDGSMVLDAGGGYYYMGEKRARFYDNVHLRDSVNTLSSDLLNYYQDIDKAVAVGNVVISDTASSIYADSLIHFRDIEKTEGYGNVQIYNPANDVTITGDTLLDNGSEDYTRITGRPVLSQSDTAAAAEKDTLFITSMLMESIEDSTDKLVVTDSVKMVRGEFASRNNKAVLFRQENKIFTYKAEEDKVPPVMWYEDSQFSGDSVFIYTEDNALSKIVMIKNAFILSRVEGYEFRFNQISGARIEIYFEDGDINRFHVTGGVLSIYYMFEENKAKGLIKASGNEAKIYFADKKISDVNLYGQPASEYHPEPVVKGNEKDFTLPQFILYEGRPVKNDILKYRNSETEK